MAQVIKQEDKQVFPKEPCDKNLLLGSIKKQQPDGVLLAVEKVILPKKNNFGKVTISVIFTIIGEMEKCTLYELDNDGQYIEYEDEMTGETRRKMYIGDGHLQTVFFPFYANLQDKNAEVDENTTLIITPGTSSYSFFKEALINGGELPEDVGRESIATNFAELNECLEDFTFLGKHEVIKGKNRSFPSLLVERISEDQVI